MESKDDLYINVWFLLSDIRSKSNSNKMPQPKDTNLLKNNWNLEELRIFENLLTQLTRHWNISSFQRYGLIIGEDESILILAADIKKSMLFCSKDDDFVVPLIHNYEYV